jgi:predicted nucleic acid-binding protein
MKAVIDSDVLIDFLQGVEAARVELKRYDQLLYSVVSWMELMCGAKTQGERKAAECLLDSMRRVDLGMEIARKAVEFRKLRKLKLPDAIILATADQEGCPLVTRNERDFGRQDPRIRIPYSVTGEGE